MTTEFTRRMMLGALPAFTLAGAASAQTAGSHIAGPVAMDINATLDAWVDAYGATLRWRIVLADRGLFCGRDHLYR